MSKEREQELYRRIDQYLGNGGLFNPEMMEHEKVRSLLLDCRETMKRWEHSDVWVIYAAYQRGFEEAKEMAAQLCESTGKINRHWFAAAIRALKRPE